jgi:hypothetical protein
MRTELHRHARAFTLTLAALASLVLAPARARAETYWLDGVEVDVTLSPERDSFVLGEPVTLELKFVEVRLQTRVKITRGGDEAIGGLVEELSASVLACDQSASVAAAARLAALEDERTVKPLAAAVAKCKNASIKYPALQALAKFPTDAAFDALRAASADPSEDFRTVVAQVVARNKHPKSAALLLSMRRDTYYGVRLMVLYAMEGKDTVAARRVIVEMTNDEHP